MLHLYHLKKYDMQDNKASVIQTSFISFSKNKKWANKMGKTLLDVCT